MANETKWTPGPWRIEHDPVGRAKIRAASRVVARFDLRAKDEDVALMAAAPGLADAGARALGWLREAFGHANAPYNEGAHRCINDLAAALTKAEGR